MKVGSYLDRDAEDDEQQICGREAGQEDVGGALETSVAADGEDDEDVAGDSEDERHSVDDQRRDQLLPVEGVVRHVGVVVVIRAVGGVVCGGGGRRRRRGDDEGPLSCWRDAPHTESQQGQQSVDERHVRSEKAQTLSIAMLRTTTR